MTRYSKYLSISWAMVFCLIAVSASGAGAQAKIPNCTAPELVCLAAANQGRSLWVRDRCRYEQRLLMERFEYDTKRQQIGEEIARRQTTVIVEPSTEVDDSGRRPVLSRVVADTNDRGEPKPADKVDPNARTGLASGVFLDAVFFPLLPENIPYLIFDEVTSSIPGERWFTFAPRPGAESQVDRPLATGLAQLDETTGEVLTIRVDGFTNLKALDKHLDKITSFTAKVDFSQFGGTYRLPTTANGSGVSDVRRFKGFFKFIFEEGKYVPILKIE